MTQRKYGVVTALCQQEILKGILFLKLSEPGLGLIV
jgi:hypothetical protein